MKTGTALVTLILVCLFIVSLAFAQTFELTVQNQHVLGTDFVFDIYMLRTGGTNLYLGNADLVLTFNSGNFSSPSYTKISSGTTRLQNFYSLSTSISGGNRAILNVGAPTIGNQTDFDNRVEVISNSGNGTLIATVKLTNISNPSGTAGLQWNKSDPNKTIVNNMQNSDPWHITDISGNGTYTNPADASLPVEVANLTVLNNSGCVYISWTTQSEIDNLGFNIYKSEKIADGYRKINKQLIPGAGSSTTRIEYSFVDENIQGNTTYYYKLENLDINGKSWIHGPVEVFVEPFVPKDFSLDQNYPNPFNPSTTISYGLPKDSHVRLQIYNIKGEIVRELVNAEQFAGIHTVNWDGRSEAGVRVPSGVYFYKIEAGEFSSIKKMILAK
jgi:hypothetical protein